MSTLQLSFQVSCNNREIHFFFLFNEYNEWPYTIVYIYAIHRVQFQCLLVSSCFKRKFHQPYLSNASFLFASRQEETHIFSQNSMSHMLPQFARHIGHIVASSLILIVIIIVVAAAVVVIVTKLDFFFFFSHGINQIMVTNCQGREKGNR